MVFKLLIFTYKNYFFFETYDTILNAKNNFFGFLFFGILVFKNFGKDFYFFGKVLLVSKTLQGVSLCPKPYMV